MCRVRYVPIAGYKMNEETKSMAESSGIEVALRPIPAANLLVPYEVTVPTIARPTPARPTSPSSACSATRRGMIGLPLRLLAREVYDKIAARVGADRVALITGEEKIKPERPRFWVCTVEAMPRDIDVDFLAIDEIQLAADPERGHVFTDRLLHARGRARRCCSARRPCARRSAT